VVNRAIQSGSADLGMTLKLIVDWLHSLRG
jgi:hypothetical protein